jgi:hypothetical protein
MINVIIPTASRPQMLRTALQSVAAQTAVDEIDRVFVSENGGNRESEKICAEFPALPITYIFRTPTPLNCSGNLFPWFGSNYSDFKPIWELSRLNVIMAELLGTVAHYSTLVVRTDALRKSAYVFDLNNPFDNDRMLIFALSVFGPLLFNPTPDTFVRNHQVQDCFNFDTDSRLKHMCGTTRWMVENSGKSWHALAAAFTKRMALCPPEADGTLKMLAMKEWCVPELTRNLALLAAA